MTAAGPRGRRCRQPEPLAPCSRAQAPRAGGLGAAFRFGWGGEGSRRRLAHEQGPAACGALGDAALPFGQGALPVCGVDAVCPAGKGAAEWRAGSWRIAGESGGSKRFAHQGTFPARRGTGTSRVSPPGTEIRALSQTERALLPATSSAVSDAASCKHASPPSLFAANIRRMRPTPASFARKLPTFRPSRRRLIPKPSRGETGGLCPHPLKGPDP